MFRVSKLPAVFFGFAFAFSITIVAQQPLPAAGPCAMPAFSKVVGEATMFNEQQEEWLGDIQALQFQKEFHVIADPEGDYLQKLGERLLAQLPPTQVHYHFVITDFPEADAFGLAGGHIYISRKIVALARSEDELAGLLGHEIGHVITRQQAIDMTRLFQATLKISSVGDRKDIYDRWNQVLDIAAKSNYKQSNKREHEEQVIADRIALYAMTRGGYQTARFADYFDRIAETKGNKGGFWSDLFGTTSSESKRLKELVRNAGPLPPECVSPLPADAAAHFTQWQKAVIESKFARAATDVPGLLKTIDLKPHLRGDLNTLQFSADGNYLLAQDGTSVFVLSHEPLASLFRIDAPDSNPAGFTPDSHAVVFYDKEMRVETWDIVSQQRASIFQLATPRHCLQTELSHSGRVLACLTSELEMQLVEVATDKTFFSQKKFFKLSFTDAFLLELSELLKTPIPLLHLAFSPDDRYFVAGHQGLGFCYELAGRAEVKLPPKLKELLTSNFAFLAADEIAAAEFVVRKPPQIVRARFPSGEELERMPGQYTGQFGAPAKGKYLMIAGGGGAYSVAAYDLEQKKIAVASKAAGFSIYAPWFAGETTGGEVGIFTLADTKLVSKVQLPDSPLGYPRASAISPDGKWLAVSGSTRGAVWDLETGERVFYIQGFDGAYFDQGQLIAKLPRHDKTPARVFRFDPVAKTTTALYNLGAEGDAEAKSDHTTTIQAGNLLLRWWVEDQKKEDQKKQSAKKLVLEIHDVHDNKKLWERTQLNEEFNIFASGAGQPLVLLISNYENILKEAKEDPVVNARLNAIEGKKGKIDSYLLRILDAATGKNLGSILVDTGNLSFTVNWAHVTGDTVMVGDSNHRTLVYSLKSGEQKGKVLGRPVAITKAGDAMLVENSPGDVNVYSTSTLQSLAHYSFSSRLAVAEFSEDEKSIYMLTADQTMYNVKNPAGH